MIVLSRKKKIVGLSHSQFYRLTEALTAAEISFDGHVYKKDCKKYCISVSDADYTNTLMILCKIKTINKE